jgi:hypothetical protein
LGSSGRNRLLRIANWEDEDEVVAQTDELDYHIRSIELSITLRRETIEAMQRFRAAANAMEEEQEQRRGSSPHQAEIKAAIDREDRTIASLEAEIVSDELRIEHLRYQQKAEDRCIEPVVMREGYVSPRTDRRGRGRC